MSMSPERLAKLVRVAPRPETLDRLGITPADVAAAVASSPRSAAPNGGPQPGRASPVT